jgi:hypothetical protein
MGIALPKTIFRSGFFGLFEKCTQTTNLAQSSLELPSKRLVPRITIVELSLPELLAPSDCGLRSEDVNEA